MADLYLLTDERLTAAGLGCGYEVPTMHSPERNLNITELLVVRRLGGYWPWCTWPPVYVIGRLVMKTEEPGGMADVSANGHGCQQRWLKHTGRALKITDDGAATE